MECRSSKQRARSDGTLIKMRGMLVAVYYWTLMFFPLAVTQSSARHMKAAITEEPKGAKLDSLRKSNADLRFIFAKPQGRSIGETGDADSLAEIQREKVDRIHDITLEKVDGNPEHPQILKVQDLDATPDEMDKLPCERVGFYRHPYDCTKFYHCSEYRTTKFNHTSGPYAGFLYKCPDGLVYDEKRGSCIWPSWSDPCQGSGELLPVPLKKFSCVTPGFQADPENCRWFYYCSDLGNGQLEAFEFLCPSDLLGYDQEKLLCNWKWTVPACASYGSKPESDIEDVSTEITLLDNKSNALNLQDVSVISKQISATRKPRRPKQIQHRNATKNKADSITREPNTSSGNKTLQVVTEMNYTNNISYKINENDYQNSSITVGTLIKTLNSTLPSTEYELPQSISTGKIKNEKQDESEKKIGTAMWHRSWINNRNNSRTLIPFSNNPNDDSERKTANHQSEFSGKNNLPSNENNFGVLTDDKISTVSKDSIESGKFFKGKVRRISLKRATTQNPNLQRENKSNINRGRNAERLPQSERKSNDQRYSLFGNVETKISNDDVEVLTVQNPSPFINTRCSKLQNLDGNNEDSSPLGCTSEVSLSLKVGRGRNPEKYILREDQIVRTSYLEKQRTNLINILNEPNDEKNRLTYEDERHFLGRRVSSLTSVDKTKEKSSISFTEIREVPLNNFGTQTEASKEIEYELQEFAASSVTNSPNSYNVEKPNIRTQFDENTRKIQDFISENATKEVTAVHEEQTLNSNDRQVKQMPIHFYPQGVLLNIDLSYVNEIPPLVLLEVDDMLKKYMNNSDIDLNVLGQKLNASAMNMTEDEESHSKEPEEIMHFIDVIENIINTSKETVSAFEDAVETESSTLAETVTVNSIIAETTQEHSTMPTKDISEKIVALDNSETVSPQDTKILDFSNNTENPDVPANHSQNIENTGVFGRRRFFRKFRYPSIREQIERQTEQLRNKEVKSDLQRPGITPQLQRYTYPLSSNGATSLRTDDSRLGNSHDKRLSIEQYTNSPVPLPFTFKEALFRQQENRKMTNFDFRNLQIQATQSSENDRSTTKLFTLPYDDIVRTSERKDNTNKFSQKNHFSQPAIGNKDLVYTTLEFNNQTDTTGNKYIDGISNAKNVVNNDTDSEYHKSRFEKEYEDAKDDRTEAGEVYNHPSINEALSLNRAGKNYQSQPVLQYAQKLSDNEPPVLKTDRIQRTQAYEHSSFDEIILQNGKRTDIPQYPVLQYGQRTLTYQHKSAAQASISYKDASSFENGRDGYNLHRIKEEPGHFTGDYIPHSKQINNSNDSKSNPVRLGDSSLVKDKAQRLSEGNPYEDNIQTNVRQYRRTSNFDTTNNTRPRKRRKLRILVKKLPNDEQKLNDSKSHIEEKISNNVLRTLKSRPLQEKADEIELQIEYQDHVWNIPFADIKSDLSPVICTRSGLFQHPRDINMFYECFWDKWLQRFTLHVFSCPVRLVYDESVRGCSRPTSDSPHGNLIK